MGKNRPKTAECFGRNSRSQKRNITLKISANKAFIVCAGKENYSKNKVIDVVSLEKMVKILQEQN